MKAGGARRQSDVGSRVHQEFDAARIGEREGALNQFEERARGEIFFADLDPIHAIQIASDASQKIRRAIAIGDVAANH